MLSIAVDGFLRELGLKDSDRHLLENQIVFRDAEPGITVLRENCVDVSKVDPISILSMNKMCFLNCVQDICLLYILSGSVSVLQQSIGMSGSKSTSNSEVCKKFLIPFYNHPIILTQKMF